MKTKLIKTEFGFKLNDLNGVYIASETTGKLSLKNCEAIERGYDLDELAKKEYFDDTGVEMLDSSRKYNDVLEELKKSLQQTEWDVEIITEPFLSVGDNFHNKYQTRPKLDENGCFILKKI